MAIDVKFDLVGNPEPPTLILANRNGNKLGQLDVNQKSIELIDKFNNASEVSFTVNKYMNGEIVPLWDLLVDFKLVYCKEWDMWFECTVELDEATESVKTVFCKQLGQAELSQIMLYDIEINTEIDIERDDYKIAILYDPIDSQCILGRLLEKAPHYSIIHVDDSLWNIQRSFSFDDTSVYDALQEIAEEIGCLFVFNSDSDADGMPQRTISVYDLQQNCLNPKCKYRGEFTDKCPKCNSEDSDGNKYEIKYGYGDDTLIFVTSDELASEGIQLVTDTDAVKNCFKLEAGDDLMTATVRNRNPNGTDYIWYFSDATKSDMPQELVDKIEEYDESYKYYYNEHVSELDEGLLNNYNNLVDKYLLYNKDLEKINNPIVGFASLMEAYYNTIDLGWYLRSGMMPKVTRGDTSAEDEGFKLEHNLPALIAVTSLKSVYPSTADSAILMMAKAIVSSKYKVIIKSSQLNTDNYGNKNKWSGIFVVTNYSDENDTYTTSTVNQTLTDYDETYIKQKIDKMLSREDNDDLSITGLFANDVTAINNGDGTFKYEGKFCEELKKYALVPLITFHDACQACLDILIEQGVGSSNNDLYNKLYIPYYNKLQALSAEIAIRENEVNFVVGKYDVNGNLLADGLQTNIEKVKNNIQALLNFEDYLGKDLWLQFCAYRREDKYHNENYISDGLNNAELFARALEFYEVAENEIFKSSELQHSISATLNNLLAIPKFKALVNSFSVGNWIRVQVDDFIYKLRLVEYEISYNDFDNISVQFSDVAKTKTGYSDLEDILSDASSMASSYDGIKRQANLGNEARDMIRQWLNEGLDASLVQIQNNTNEDIVIDNNGLIGRSYSDITEEYSPEQIRLTHNIIAFTNDNWASVKMAIGKHKYKYYDASEIVYDENGNEIKGDFVDAVGYGMSADFVVSGVVEASQIIGGDIYSDNYIQNTSGSYINLRDGTFDFGGGRITFNGDELRISSPDILTEEQVTIITESTIKTTNIYAENLSVNAAKVTGKLEAAEIDAGKITSGTLTGRDIYGGSLLIGIKPYWDEYGNYINSSYAEITPEGVLNCNAVNVTGNISGSSISGSSISGGSLYISGKYYVYDEHGNYIINPDDGTYLTETKYASIVGGVLDCYGANITGTINATAGNIGGCTIVNGNLQVNSANIIGDLTATSLKGETVNLLDSNGKVVGIISLRTTTTDAFDITSNYGLRLNAAQGKSAYFGVANSAGINIGSYYNDDNDKYYHYCKINGGAFVLDYGGGYSCGWEDPLNGKVYAYMEGQVYFKIIS